MLINKKLGKQHSTVVVIGNFDGVHLGHQQIIRLAKAKAMAENMPLVAISFKPNPNKFFVEDYLELSGTHDKARVLQELGVDNLLLLNFNSSLAKVKPRQFIQDVLLQQANIKHLFVGKDFRFGHKRAGDIHTLAEYAEKFKLHVVEDVLLDGQKVSSTRIRQLLRENTKQSLSLANELLGRHYSVRARVQQVIANPSATSHTLSLNLAEELPLSGTFKLNLCIKGNIQPATAKIEENRACNVEGVTGKLDGLVKEFITLKFIEKID